MEHNERSKIKTCLICVFRPKFGLEMYLRMYLFTKYRSHCITLSTRTRKTAFGLVRNSARLLDLESTKDEKLYITWPARHFSRDIYITRWWILRVFYLVRLVFNLLFQLASVVILCKFCWKGILNMFLHWIEEKG